MYNNAIFYAIVSRFSKYQQTLHVSFTAAYHSWRCKYMHMSVNHFVVYKLYYISWGDTVTLCYISWYLLLHDIKLYLAIHTVCIHIFEYCRMLIHSITVCSPFTKHLKKKKTPPTRYNPFFETARIWIWESPPMTQIWNKSKDMLCKYSGYFLGWSQFLDKEKHMSHRIHAWYIYITFTMKKWTKCRYIHISYLEHI